MQDKKKGKAADPGDLKSKVSQAGGRSQDPKLPGASTVTSSQCENSGKLFTACHDFCTLLDMRFMQIWLYIAH